MMLKKVALISAVLSAFPLSLAKVSLSSLRGGSGRDLSLSKEILKQQLALIEAELAEMEVEDLLVKEEEEAELAEDDVIVLEKEEEVIEVDYDEGMSQEEDEEPDREPFDDEIEPDPPLNSTSYSYDGESKEEDSEGAEMQYGEEEASLIAEVHIEEGMLQEDNDVAVHEEPDSESSDDEMEPPPPFNPTSYSYDGESEEEKSKLAEMEYGEEEAKLAEVFIEEGM